MRKHTHLTVNGRYTEVTLIAKPGGIVSIVFADGQILRVPAGEIADGTLTI
jgi:hypothetical protein